MSIIYNLEAKLKDALAECQELDKKLSEREEFYRKTAVANANSADSKLVCLLHDKHPEIYFELLDLLED